MFKSKYIRVQSGFSTLEYVIGAVLVITIAIGGWMAWQNYQTANAPSSPGGKTTKGTLVITEWDVKLPLTSGITDATYTMNSDGVANVTTAKLEKLIGTVNGCTTGLYGVYIARSADEPTATSEWGPVHVGTYHYSPASIIAPACAVQLSPETGKAIDAINTELKAAAGKLTAK